MSTWLYLECLDHDPPLMAESESGQHLYDLDQIRKDIANRDVLVQAYRLLTEFEVNDHFRRNTINFLAAHPKCHIGIRDEYGREHPVEGGEEDNGTASTDHHG